MSKEPTSKGRLDTDEEMGGARRKRRRRGGGLRVPSDKVPRATTNREADLVDPPEPPEPEAPELAVSVADAFGGEGIPPADGAGYDGVGEATAESEPAEPAAGLDEAVGEEAEADDAPRFARDPEPARDVDPEPARDVDLEPEPDFDSHAASEADADPEVVRGEGAEEDEAAGDDEATKVQVFRPDSRAAGDGEARRIRIPRPDSLSDTADYEDDEAGEAEAEAAGDEGLEASAPDEVAEAESPVGYDSVEIAIEDEPPPPQPRMPRAQTEALTEEDLEELMEPIEDEAEEAAAALAGVPAHAPGPAPADASDDEVDFDAQETAQFVPVVIEDSESSEDEPAGDGSADDPDAKTVTVLERRDGDGGRDPADSGELLSDELVQEIEEAALAAGAEAAAKAEKSARGATLLDGDGVAGAGESRGDENSAPPPVPGDTPAKPPPAPAAAAAPAIQASKGRTGAYGKAWFDEIFDDDYLRTLPFLTPQATQSEARFVADAIAASPGAQLLDLGCGYGRHAMELAARGYHVVGLDSSLPLLLRGADEAQRRGLTINFVHGDMRELTFESQFDAAYCLFSTFGYFDDETNKKTAQNVSRALKTGARFVVEVLNRDYLIQDLPTRVWWEGDGCVVLEEVDFNYFSSRIVSNRSVVFDDGRQLEQEISIRAYSLHEMGKLLHAAGFRVLEVSGNMTTRGRFFGAKARDIIVVAEKRGTGT